MYNEYIIACNTDEDVTKVLFKLETEDYRWRSGHKPLQWLEDSYSAQVMLKAPVAIVIHKDKTLGICGIRHGNISAEGFLSGGKKEMKKSNLKTGYIVVLRDGTEMVVALNCSYDEYDANDIIINCGQRKWFPLDVYTEDLLFTAGSKLNDIIKIYKASYPLVLGAVSYETNKRKLLWQREEPKELTIKQIEEILGYSIKIIKE